MYDNIIYLLYWIIHPNFNETVKYQYIFNLILNIILFLISKNLEKNYKSYNFIEFKTEKIKQYSDLFFIKPSQSNSKYPEPHSKKCIILYYFFTIFDYIVKYSKGKSLKKL